MAWLRIRLLLLWQQLLLYSSNFAKMPVTRGRKWEIYRFRGGSLTKTADFSPREAEISRFMCFVEGVGEAVGY